MTPTYLDNHQRILIQVKMADPTLVDRSLRIQNKNSSVVYSTLVRATMCEVERLNMDEDHGLSCSAVVSYNKLLGSLSGVVERIKKIK